jgi:hypothetical protein
MGKKKSITAFEVEYGSITDLATAFNVPVARVRARILRGLTPEDAVSHKRIANKNPNRGTPITVFGVDYPNMKAALQAHNVNSSSVTRAIRSGMSREEAIEYFASLSDDYHHASKTITVRGVAYRCISDFCRSLGLHPDQSKIREIKRKNPGLCDSDACELWLSNREATKEVAQAKKAISKVRAEEKRSLINEKLRAKEANKLIGGEFTPVRFCNHCGSAHKFESKDPKGHAKRTGKTGYQSFCSDLCRDASKEIARKKDKATRRKKEKELGLRERRRLIKRAKKVGAKYENGINAKKLAELYNHICQMCGDKVEPHKGKGWQPKGWSVGHVIPNSKGGSLTWENVWCECCECNSRKADQILPRFAFRQVTNPHSPSGSPSEQTAQPCSSRPAYRQPDLFEMR